MQDIKEVRKEKLNQINKMGFNKRFISKKTLKIIANINNFEYFYKYFKADAIIFEDDFSNEIFNQIKMYKLSDKQNIIAIMNKCKEL